MDTIPRFILFVCLASAACMAQRQLGEYHHRDGRIIVKNIDYVHIQQNDQMQDALINPIKGQSIERLA